MSNYFTKLESLRGVAAFAIVLFHSPFYQTGNPNAFIANANLFVDFFFILSGFVMMHAYGERIRAGFRFRDYFILRLGRLYPLHFVMLLAWAGLVAVKWILFAWQIEPVNPALKNTGESFVANILLIHSLHIHEYLSWNYPSWSVSVEFFTYIGFFLFCVVTRKSRNPFIPLIVSCLAYYYILNSSDWQTLDFTNINGIFRCIGGFFAGVFLYQVTTGERGLSRLMTGILEFSAVGLIVLTFSYASEPGIHVALVIPAMALAICVFSLESDGPVGKMLKLRPFTLAGKYSYSIYLVHALVLEIVFSVVKYLIVRPTGDIFYVQFEYANVVNIGLMALIFVVARTVYHAVEERWLRKSRRLIGDLDQIDQIEEKKSVFV